MLPNSLQKYYLDVILKELDACNGISPQTYVSCSAHDEEIVLEHEEFMARQNVKCFCSIACF